jgi:hypothetical protein
LPYEVENLDVLCNIDPNVVVQTVTVKNSVQNCIMVFAEYVTAQSADAARRYWDGKEVIQNAPELGKVEARFTTIAKINLLCTTPCAPSNRTGESLNK